VVDAKDPRVTSTHGHDPDASGPAPGDINPATGQHASYWVLTPEERAKGFVRPVRRGYVHTAACGTVTTMGLAIAETYAREPTFYGSTFCVHCGDHFPVAQFTWDGGKGELVGS